MNNFKKIVFVCSILNTCFFPLVIGSNLGVNLLKTSYDFGSGSRGNYTTWFPTTDPDKGFFGVQNWGSVAEKISIKVSSSTIWAVGTTPGSDRFALQWGKTITMGLEPNWLSITDVPITLTSILGPDATFYFDLRFQAPTSSKQDGLQNFAVVIKAEVPEGYNYFPEGDFYWKVVSFGNWEPDWSGPYDHMVTEQEFASGAISPIDLWSKSGYPYAWTPDPCPSPPYPPGTYWYWWDCEGGVWDVAYHYGIATPYEYSTWKIVVLDDIGK